MNRRASIAILCSSAWACLWAPDLAFGQSAALEVGTPVVEGDWTFHPLPQTLCRRGETTGIAVRYANAPSDKALVTMQGGGACYNLASCTANAYQFGPTQFRNAARGSVWSSLNLTTGVWDTTALDNALADYHHVFIPYCSGDFHAGANDRVVDGFQQQYRGYENTGRFFQYIVEHVVPELVGPNPEIVLAGYSAGGFGATLNMPRLAAMLPTHVKLSLLVDSAPMFTTDLMPACLQKRWHDTFRFDQTFFAECGSSCTAGDWMSPFLTHVLATYSNVPHALISSTHDATIRIFTGYLSVLSFCSRNPSEAEYRAGLLAIRHALQQASQSQGTDTASFFIPNSTQHVFMTSAYFDPDSAAAGVPVRAFVEALFDRPPAGPLYQHLGP